MYERWQRWITGPLLMGLLIACSQPDPGGLQDLTGDGPLDSSDWSGDKGVETDLARPETGTKDVPGIDLEDDMAGDIPDWPDVVLDADQADFISSDLDASKPQDTEVYQDLPADGESDEIDAGPPCELDEICDDEDPCTLDDICTEDGCIGVPLDCSDGLPCTFDLCQDGACENPFKPGWCFILGQCFQEGIANPNNPCLECITAVQTKGWSPDDSNACEDGNMCTDIDKCADGKCLGNPVDCNDDNPCSEDICTFGQCSHVPLNGLACEDGDLCTIDDICFAGECEAGQDLRECEDYNPCTVDICDPSDGCVYTPVDDLPCNDGNLCTENDYCKSSVCMPGTPLACDDLTLCTTDTCSPLIGCKYINNSLSCDDGNPCTVGDKCLGGLCKKGPDELNCEDDNSCTSEWCAQYVGCQFEAIEAPCNDGNGCTFGDHCQEGECLPDWTMDCTDDNPCTDDFCDPASGCANLNNSIPCDDGNPCTIGDQCVQGACTSGPLPLDCFDDNPCATGTCQPFVGCIIEYLDGKECEDGDVCTVSDYCLEGECHPGDPDVFDCSDGNVCTVDWCDPVIGCLHENIEALCDDLNLCSENDHCIDGLCIGTPVSCDDDNQCTIDACQLDMGCVHSVVVSAYCQPQIIIDYPLRATELIAPPTSITVQGHVVHNAAPVAWVNINGDEVALNPDDSFSYQMTVAQGVNIIDAELFDLFDGHDKVVQTFIASTAFVPMNAGNPDVSMIHDSVMIFLGQNVWDDNTPDPNDFATFFTYFFNSINLSAMMPNPLFENSSYKIKAKNFSHGAFTLDITCINGGIHLVAEVPNLHVGLDADSKKWYLPGASGKVDANKLVIDMDVMLSVVGNGDVKANLTNVSVDVKGLNVSLDGVLGFLLNWLVDFFEGTFASTLEDEVEKAIKDTLPATLEDALEDLAFNTEFEVPPFLGDGDPVTLSMVSRVSSINFTPIGGTIGLKAAVVTPKGVNLPSKGSLRRGACLGQASPFSFWMLDEIEMGIHDDFLNQIPYAMWWAGILTIPIDAETMGGGSFEEYGIDNMNIVATALAPPVITDCGYNTMQMQLGDLELYASFSMWGMDVEVIMYVTFTAGIKIGVETVDGQVALQMGVTKVNEVLLEVATVSENLVGSEDTLKILVINQVLPVFLDQLTGDSLASFPLPEMDMTGLIPGMPGEAKLEMTPKSTYREKAYTVITGSVHE